MAGLTRCNHISEFWKSKIPINTVALKMKMSESGFAGFKEYDDVGVTMICRYTNKIRQERNHENP